VACAGRESSCSGQTRKEESGGNQAGLLVQEPCLDVRPPTSCGMRLLSCRKPRACGWASAQSFVRNETAHLPRKGQWKKGEDAKLCLSRVSSGWRKESVSGSAARRSVKTAIMLISGCLLRNNQTCAESCDLSDPLTELQLKRFTIKGCFLLLIFNHETSYGK